MNYTANEYTVREIAATARAAGHGETEELETLVTTLAAQLGYRCAEGGSSPDHVIRAGDALTILGAVAEMVEQDRRRQLDGYGPDDVLPPSLRALITD